jgi:hypothetical protein
MKIYDLLTELGTWFSLSKELLDKAKSSKITSENNTQFKQLVDGWSEGLYDEDPGLVMNEIESLLEC